VFLVSAGRREGNPAVEAEYAEAFDGRRARQGRRLLIDILLIAVGLVMLVAGSRWFIEGIVALARGLGVSELVIGLTIVAAGTSMPEVATSVVAAPKGERDIAVGNVVGSNICNIALILGLAALFNPIKSDPVVLKRDIPVMLGISMYLVVLTLNSTLGRIEGATLFAGIILYTFINYYLAKKEVRASGSGEMTAAIESELKEIGYIASRPKQILLVTIGIIGVVGGAQIVVESAIYIMTRLGVSEKFIGLTIVAFGTSLPELATSVVAAMRGEMDISIGNLVGSNVFNIMSVLGVASLVRPIPIPGGFFESGLWIDYLVMLFTSFLPWLLMRKTYSVNRRGGALLIACYVAYLVYLIIRA